MRKKIGICFFFCNFPATGKKKKGETKKKNVGAEIGMGYCPNCVVTKGLGSWALGAERRRARHDAGRAGARSASGRTGRAAGASSTQAWARPGCAAGPVGCALGALSMF